MHFPIQFSLTVLYFLTVAVPFYFFRRIPTAKSQEQVEQIKSGPEYKTYYKYGQICWPLRHFILMLGSILWGQVHTTLLVGILSIICSILGFIAMLAALPWIGPSVTETYKTSRFFQVSVILAYFLGFIPAILWLFVR